MTNYLTFHRLFIWLFVLTIFLLVHCLFLINYFLKLFYQLFFGFFIDYFKDFSSTIFWFFLSAMPIFLSRGAFLVVGVCLNEPGQAKVCQLDAVVGGDEDVARRYVPVNKVLWLEVGEGGGELVAVKHEGGQVQPRLVRLQVRPDRGGREFV